MAGLLLGGDRGALVRPRPGLAVGLQLYLVGGAAGEEVLVHVTPVLVGVDDCLTGQGVDTERGIHARHLVLVAVEAVELGVRVRRELQPGLAVRVLPGLPVEVPDAPVPGARVAVPGDGVSCPGPPVLAGRARELGKNRVDLPLVEEVDDASQDILNALLALGYNEKEAGAALKQLPPDLSTSDGIRQALKLLSKV